MRTFGRIALVLVVAVATLLPACNKSDSGAGGQPYVAFVSNNNEEFWTICRRGTEQAEKDFNVKCEFRTPTAGAADQRRIIEDLQTKGVQAIAVSPEDSANQVAFFKSLNKKVPVVAVDNDVPDNEARRCYLGTDNVAAGRAVGKLIKQHIPDGGKFMIFVGKLDAQNAQERRHGVVIELAGGEDKCQAELEQLKQGKYPIKFGKYELMDTRTDDVKRAVCQAKCEDALGKVPGLVCLVGLWAYNPPAMLLATQSQIKTGAIKPGQVTLIGFDEDEATLNAIRSGDIAGTVVQDPYNFGYEAVRIMAGIVRGDANAITGGKVKPNEKKQIYIPHRIINKDGKPLPAYEGELVEAVDPFQAELKKRLGK